jgi:hypothetical protein
MKNKRKYGKISTVLSPSEENRRAEVTRNLLLNPRRNKKKKRKKQGRNRHPGGRKVKIRKGTGKGRICPDPLRKPLSEAWVFDFDPRYNSNVKARLERLVTEPIRYLN